MDTVGFVRSVSWLLTLLSFGCPLLAGDVRLPVPNQAKQTETRRLVRDVFKTDYIKTSAADRAALATKLLTHADETKDDPASRFVLLREARDLAAQGGDAETAFAAAERLVKDYAVNSGEEQLTVVPRLEAAARTPEQAARLAEALLAASESAIAAGEYAGAEGLLSRAEAVATRARSMPLVTRARSRKKEIQDLAQQAKAIESARQTLTANPDDPEANLAVGTFTCLVKDDWANGLPLLAKSSDATLKALAEKDLAAPMQVDEQMALADGWWTQGQAAAGPQREQLLDRAAKWYRAALPKLSGIHRSKAEQRLAERKPSGAPTATTSTARPPVGPAAGNYVGTWVKQDTGTEFLFSKESEVFKLQNGAPVDASAHFGRGRWLLEGNRLTLRFQNGGAVVVNVVDGRQMQHASAAGGGQWNLLKR